MQVILLERVAKLGQMGDVVDVKPGFARNFPVATGQGAVSVAKPTLKPLRAASRSLKRRTLKAKKKPTQWRTS